MAVWRWAGASRRGTSHVKAGTKKQDAFSCFTVFNDLILISIVSDGAGSASKGGEGASILCRTMASALRSYFALSSDLPEDERVWHWLDAARDRISIAATRRGLTPRDFAATMVMIATSGDNTLVAHVGDGAVVARQTKSGVWQALSWPAQGEYASTTFFITDDPVPRLRFMRYNLPFDAVAVFSDGIERLALDYAEAVAHQPFFKGIIAPLETGQAVGSDPALSAQLGAYLDSPAVCERTDDDKTLVLALRR